MKIYFAPDTSDHPNWGCRVMGDWFRKLDKGAMEKFARQKLSELGNYTWSDFAQKHGADIALVNAFAESQPSGVIALPEVNPKLGAWQQQRVLEGLAEVLANEAAPANVKDAAARLKVAIEAKPSDVFGAVLRLFEDGLVKLRADAFPADWVTTDRPRV